MERRLGVGSVDRHAAGVRLRVQRAARGDERGDVGDRVAHAVPVAPALEVHRLVEVAGAGRVDRDERDLDAVAAALAARGGSASASAGGAKPSGTPASRRIASKPSRSSPAGSTRIQRAGIARGYRERPAEPRQGSIVPGPEHPESGCWQDARMRRSPRAAAFPAPTRATRAMATITEHELEQIDQANAAGGTPVVFIHGLWLLPSSWDRWAARVRGGRLRHADARAGPTIPRPSTRPTPTRRCSPTRPSARSPTTSRRSSGSSSKKPAVIGHSFGGLLDPDPRRPRAGRGVGGHRPGAVPRRAAAADLGAEVGLARCSATRPTATAPSR